MVQVRTDKTPGYTNVEELFHKDLNTTFRLAQKLVKFINVPKDSECADISIPNPKMEFVKTLTGISVDQIYVEDFNFDKLWSEQKYDVIFCLEVLEHVQNPLFLMQQIKNLLKSGGTIYLSMPSNPVFLRYDYHFYEMKRDFFEKWILKPLNLKIVRHKKFNFVNDYKTMLIGFRPLLRIFKTGIKPILWGFIQINNFYEIKQEDIS